MLEHAKMAGIPVIIEPNAHQLWHEIANADIVQMEWWNHPLISRLLWNFDFPDMRLLIWSHVSGLTPPMLIIQELIEFADLFVCGTPYSFNNPAIQQHRHTGQIGMVQQSTGIERTHDVQSRKHKGFQVGYIGTLDYYKMHPEFIDICAIINIPNVQFIVCGEGDNLAQIKMQAQQAGLRGKITFTGYVENINDYLAVFDVFGYPLNRDHYGTTELVLIEAMAAGIPPVVFSGASEQYVVTHNQTGLVVDTHQEYASAIEFLYRHPSEKVRLGQNARQYVQEYFSIEKVVENITVYYRQLLARQKHPHIFPLHGNASYQQFMAFTGKYKTYFEQSIQQKNRLTSKAVEQTIAQCSQLMQARTRGSIFHYLRYNPTDPWLNYWAGLIEEQKKKAGWASAFSENV